MADFSSLKQTIQTYIKQNGNEEITGNILQDVLLAMVTTMGDGAINTLTQSLQNEITARGNADGTLQQNIDNEATARGNADTLLQTAINGINTKLAEGCVYAGIATPSTNPGTPSGKVFYIAVSSGTYTNFSNLTVAQGINILKYNGSVWSKDVVYAIDARPKKASQNLVTSGGVFDNIGALDVSELNATENPHTLAQYADLSAALAAISSDYQKGGMSIKFVHDNKYVQYRCNIQSFSVNPNDWADVNISLKDTESDFSIKDEDSNAIVTFKNGNIKTKNFDSAQQTAKLDTIEEGAEVNNIESATNEDFDLTFEDEEGNIIVGLSGGHIKTKNFNSRDIYNNPSSYLGRDISTFAKIMCIGDSLTEGAFNYLSGSSFGNNTTASALGRPYSYPQYLAKLTGCEVTNLGKSGFTSTQWYDYYTTGAGASTDFSGYDCAIIQLGVNDDSATLDTITKTALDNIITKVKTANAGIKIFFAGIINAKSYPAATEGESYYAKDQWLKNYYNTYYANDAQVFFIDHVSYGHLRDLPNAQHGGSYPVDNYNEGHLSAYGYWRLAQDYVSMISYIMHNDQIGKFRKIQFIGTSYECY